MEEPEYPSFLRGLDLTAYLGVDPQSWDRIRDAVIRDWGEGGRYAEHLVAALVGYPTAKFLEPLRAEFSRNGNWPARWEDAEFTDEEPSIPMGHAQVYDVYVLIPASIRMKLDHWEQGLSNNEIAMLDALGLVDNSEVRGWEGYLKRFPMDDVRAIARSVGAPKGRSKESIIRGIVAMSDPAEIVRAVVDLKGRWVRSVINPLRRLPGEWVAYQQTKAYMLEDFLWSKYRSWARLLQGGRGKHERSVDCKKSCQGRNRDFRWAKGLKFFEYPPWYPGCGCHLW